MGNDCTNLDCIATKAALDAAHEAIRLACEPHRFGEKGSYVMIPEEAFNMIRAIFDDISLLKPTDNSNDAAIDG